uniref:NADH dehydrogenase subunit 4 n=1 Tax=Eupatorus hardwickei TaxID=2950138 RepID=UPI0021B55B16|nr:NADH dehydrogenase subunit 4 [Eupatorus hardwickei]UWI70888.1 NADH dehydrogenase subunit 4 [Eupatorus hardwickei]
MMKFFLSLIFMVPMSFLPKSFWLNQYFYFIITFLYCFMFSFNYQFSYISYFMGCDLLSFMMVMLSFWICSLMILASQKIFQGNYYYNLFLLVMIVLLLSLYLTFSSMNMFIFYLFFEVSLIPTLILIVGWGYQPERLQAGIYLLFYTLFASLPMMVSIFYCYKIFNSLDYFFLCDFNNNIFMYMCMNMVFFIKIPMYFVHLWLPKAHVEAPVAGSMILAGVMLKLGGYGLMRFMSIFLTVGIKVNFIFIIISMIGGIFVSLICLRQIDIKSLIAYSSVSHMGLVLGGIMTLNYWGMSGALVMMIAHGLCSSGLFCLANILYERTHSRSFFLNKGLINLMPIMSLWWFLFSCCNMAAPPSLNLLGEIMLINSLISWSNWTMVFIMFMSFFSAAYSLYLYSYTQHGKFYMGLYSFSSDSIREYLLLLLHWLPLNLMILKSEYVVLWL